MNTIKYYKMIKRHNWLKAPIVIFLRVVLTSSKFQGSQACTHASVYIPLCHLCELVSQLVLLWDMNLLCYIHDPHEDVSGILGYLKW